MQKNLSDRKFAESIGLSGPGYKSMLEQKTCTVEKLELICTLYSVPITYFFEDEMLVASDQPVTYKTKENLKKDALIDFMKEQLREKDNMIAKLNRELGKTDNSLKEHGQAG